MNVGEKTPHTNEKRFIKHRILKRSFLSADIKHCILMRSDLSADKTPHTNKEEVYRYKVPAHDVLSTI